MSPCTDFCTNEKNNNQLCPSQPRRHPDLNFDDGNLAILTGDSYFLVHQGLLCRHSPPLNTRILKIFASPRQYLEGRPVLQVQELPADMAVFLTALYDGVSMLSYGPEGFPVISSVLRLSKKYEVKHLHDDVLNRLLFDWPMTLAQWDKRESKASSTGDAAYSPREYYPHPISIISLAREVDAPELLPSAFYDLSRCPPSELVGGHTCPRTSATQRLSQEDLLNLFRGREYASRFLSRFIASGLEGRRPPATCARDTDGHRSCQAAFEAITFELLRSINSAGERSSDPLFNLLNAEILLDQEFATGDSPMFYRACENCRPVFHELVESVREDLWSKIPYWFGLELPA